MRAKGPMNIWKQWPVPNRPICKSFYICTCFSGTQNTPLAENYSSGELTQTTTLEILIIWKQERWENGRSPWKGEIFAEHTCNMHVLVYFFACNHSEMIRFVSCLCRVAVGAEIMFCAEGCTAVIDTGSSYITGPASSISMLMKTIGAQLDETGVSLKLMATKFPTKNNRLQKPPKLYLPLFFKYSIKSTATLWRCCLVSRFTWEARTTLWRMKII